MLGALAAQTRRVCIGPAVTYAVYPSSHHPSWLAKRATTVDHLSNGRLDLRLGIGAEDNATREVWQSHGIRYPPRAERVAGVAEAVDMIRALWQGGPVDRRGGFGDLSSALGGPPPVQRPGPPVWIAAMSVRALAMVARQADGWEARRREPAPARRRCGRRRRRRDSRDAPRERGYTEDRPGDKGTGVAHRGLARGSRVCERGWRPHGAGCGRASVGVGSAGEGVWSRRDRAPARARPDRRGRGMRQAGTTPAPAAAVVRAADDRRSRRAVRARRGGAARAVLQGRPGAVPADTIRPPRAQSGAQIGRAHV